MSETKSEPQPVKVGEFMPRLGLRGEDDTAADPLDHEGPAVVYFMRTFDCAICKRHARELGKLRERLRASGTDVAVVGPGGPDEARALREELREGSGTDLTVYFSDAAHDAVGLHRRLFGRLRQSGTFLIDGDGVVRYARTATVPTGAFDRDGLLRAVEDLEK